MTFKGRKLEQMSDLELFMFVICLIIFGMSAGIEIVQILFGRPYGWDFMGV